MQFDSSLTLFHLNTPILLEKRIKLLQEIDRLGSISQAAKSVPMSYKSAWDTVDSINNLSPYRVVEKSTGGKGGGGATLTSYGKNLIDSYRFLKSEHEKFLSKLTEMTNFNTGNLNSIKRIAMEISARNQIVGKISSIEIGKVNAQITVKLKSGYSLISVITKGATEELELKEGDEVIAIFKSSSVLLSLSETLGISARNILRGDVETISMGEVNSEVVVSIGDDKIASVVTAQSVKAMKLQEGTPVSVVIKASDIMIGK